MTVTSTPWPVTEADDDDPGVRVGEVGGVLEQLGEQVRDGQRVPAGDVGVLRHRQVDPVERLDLADRGADDVGQRQRLRSRRVESMPASTSRLSALRRIRVARWSSLNRLSRTSGSSSRDSIVSSWESWRPSSTWLRRATLTNISAMLDAQRGLLLRDRDGDVVDGVERLGQPADLVVGLDRDRLDDDAGSVTRGLHPLDHLRQLVRRSHRRRG